MIAMVLLSASRACRKASAARWATTVLMTVAALGLLAH
jgi:hypothetical protein